MKKSLLFLMTVLSIVFIGNVYAEDKIIVFTYGDDVKLTHRNEGHTKQYIDITGITSIPVPGQDGYLCWTKSDAIDPYIIQVPEMHVAPGDSPEDVNVATDYHCYPLEFDITTNAFKSVNVSKFGRWFYEEDYNNFYIVQTKTDELISAGNNDPQDPSAAIGPASSIETTLYKSLPLKVTRANYKTGSINSVEIKAKGYEDGSNSIIKVRTPYENTGLKRHIKIVKIEDENILKSMAKKEAGAYNNLKKYIKNNDGYTAEQKYSEKELNTSDLQLEDGAYYGIYIYYNTNDRLDYTDIIVSKATKNGTYLSGSADLSKFAQEETKGEEEKNPKTGLANYYWIAPIVILLGISLFAIIKHNRLFKSI